VPPDRFFLSSRADRTDVDEENVPIRLTARRAVEAARDFDVILSPIRMEEVGPVGAIVDGEARGAGSGDCDEGE
jgi:hypothetical protein